MKVMPIWSWLNAFLIYEKFYAIEEVNYEAEAEKILIGLGFVREDFTRQTEFSDGECELSWLKSFCKNRI
jgi:hypothetical protein